MLKSFDEAEKMLLSSGRKYTVALCGAENENSLEAVIQAKKAGIAEGILLGDKERISFMLRNLGENPEDYSLYEACGFEEMAEAASDMFLFKRADIIMDGSLETKEFLYAVNRIDAQMSTGGRYLNRCCVFEHPKKNTIIFAANSLFGEVPGITEKVAMIRNSVSFAKAFGYENPVVSVVSVLENDAAARTLAASVWNDCEIKGPQRLDEAIEGGAEILIMPDMFSGAILFETLDYFTGYKVSSVLCGAVPTALTSPRDETETKYNSILSAAVQCAAKN